MQEPATSTPSLWVAVPANPEMIFKAVRLARWSCVSVIMCLHLRLDAGVLPGGISGLGWRLLGVVGLRGAGCPRALWMRT